MKDFVGNKNKSLKLSYILSLALLLVIVVTIPVWGQSILNYIVPREVEKLPSREVTFEPTPAAPRLMEQDQVEKMAGFSLLVPAYLPSGCSLQERFYVSQAKAVYLTYSCGGFGLSIVQQKAETIQRPYIGKDSTQELTIGGQPAIYIDGIWNKFPEEEEPVWLEGISHQLFFEQDSHLIRLSAAFQLTKDELIKVAESLE